MIWKDIPGYEGSYEVSEFGDVKSKSRWTVQSNGKNRFLSEKILKPFSSDKKRFSVRLANELGEKDFKTYQLVAMAFLGHVPCGYKIIVDHKDNNPLNNHFSNLRLTSPRDNTSKDRKGYTSKYIGVSWDKQRCKWKSNIYIGEKLVFLGRFVNEIDASNAYIKRLKEIENVK